MPADALIVWWGSRARFWTFLCRRAMSGPITNYPLFWIKCFVITLFSCPLSTSAPVVMPYKQNPRIIRHVFQHQAVPGGDNKDDAGVWQDKNAAARKRAATSQPVTAGKPLRTQTAHAETPPATPQPGPKRKRAYIMLWVNPVVKEELERRARRNRISLSSAGAALL